VREMQFDSLGVLPEVATSCFMRMCGKRCDQYVSEMGQHFPLCKKSRRGVSR